MGRERTIKIVTADQPGPAPYFSYDAVLNARERRTLPRGAPSASCGR